MPFIQSSEAILLDLAAKRYGQRPSDMIGITDRRAAYNFDTALAFRVAQMERPNADSSSPVKSKKKQGLTISNGMLLGGFTGVIGEV